MAEDTAKREYQFISFFVAELPDDCAGKATPETAIKLSQQLFGFADVDFSPAHGGRYHGKGKYGYTFEVYVKHQLAQILAAKNHANVYYIFE